MVTYVVCRVTRQLSNIFYALCLMTIMLCSISVALMFVLSVFDSENHRVRSDFTDFMEEHGQEKPGSFVTLLNFSHFFFLALV